MMPMYTGADGKTREAEGVAFVDPVTGLPVSMSSTTAPWDGTAIDAAGFEEIQLGVSGLGANTITVKGSVTGANPVTLTGVNMATNATVTSITADGLYSFPACGKVEYSKSGGAPTVNLLRK